MAEIYDLFSGKSKPEQVCVAQSRHELGRSAVLRESLRRPFLRSKWREKARARIHHEGCGRFTRATL